MKLKRTELCDGVVGGFDLIISRTGYTGEKMAFELFPHPDRAVDFWNALLKAGRAVRHQADRPGRARLAAHRSRPAALRSRDGPGLRQVRRTRSGRGRRRLRLLRQAVQALVHRARSLHGARKGSARAWWSASASTSPGYAWRITAIPVVNAERRTDRLGDELRGGRGTLPDRPGLPGPRVRREGTPILIHQGGVMDRPATPAKVVSRFPKG